MRNDLSGHRFGKLTVLRPTEQRENGYVVWQCRCDCGNEILLNSQRLKPGAAYSCGCEKNPANRKDLTGLRFGRLTVLGKSENRAADRSILWQCRCDCGKIVEVKRGKLLGGDIRSCGCGRFSAPADWTGRRFGRLTVMAYAGKQRNGHYWRCICDCGKEIVARQSNLQNGQTTSCGCKKDPTTVFHYVDGTCIEMIASRNISRANTSGVRGVYYNKQRSKWIAQIMFQGKCYYLGGFANLEDAAKARAKGEEMLFDNFLEWYSGKR